MNARQSLLIAAALALALPAFAANENGKPAPQAPAAEKAAPAAKDQATAKVEKEQVAEEEGAVVKSPFPGRKSTEMGVPDKATGAPIKSLRFEHWVHDEDHEY